MKTAKIPQYAPPVAEELPVLLAGLLCTSPELGENEGIDYEDLVI